MTTRSAVSIKNLFALKELDAGKPVRRISLQQVTYGNIMYISILYVCYLFNLHDSRYSTVHKNCLGFGCSH